MIDLLRRGHCVRQSGLNFDALDRRTTAGRTPIRYGLFGEYGATVSADAFHIFKITGSGHNIAAAKLEICTLRFGWWQLIWMERCCRPLRRR